ncbi:MAG: radical SAM family heme chaperone HemW [Planctomycetaceae bacterium]
MPDRPTDVSPADQSSLLFPADPENAPSALYVHVPFCLHRCGYCDFTLIADRDDLVPAWLTSLANELSVLPQRYPIKTLFIGGGTPTHLMPDQLNDLLQLLHRHFEFNQAAEVSVEANPDGLDDDRLNALRDLGVNRLSLGVQSFDADVLKLLERCHTVRMAQEVIERAADRFRNVSVDLIFGVPGQSIDCWQQTLDTATQLPITHASTYGLTFEKGTDFFKRMTAGDLQQMPDELERQQYGLAMDHFQAAGFQHYEISSYAQPGWQCRHNHVYWAADGYFGFGPGAARYIDGVRSTNARSVTRWIRSWQQHQPAIQDVDPRPPEDQASEAIYLGLRRIDGINLESFCRRFGVSVADVRPQALETHLESGLLTIENGHLKLTRDGIFLADSVVMDFL